jgi:hypothetical protein
MDQIWVKFFFFEALLLETGGSKEKTMWKEEKKKKNTGTKLEIHWLFVLPINRDAIREIRTLLKKPLLC